jgi:hypothetical protein
MVAPKTLRSVARAIPYGIASLHELTPGTYQLKVGGSQVQQTVNIVAVEVTKINFASL